MFLYSYLADVCQYSVLEGGLLPTAPGLPTILWYFALWLQCSCACYPYDQYLEKKQGCPVASGQLDLDHCQRLSLVWLPLLGTTFL